MAKDDGDNENMSFVSKTVRKIDASGSVIEEKSFFAQADTIEKAVEAFERIVNGDVVVVVGVKK